MYSSNDDDVDEQDSEAEDWEQCRSWRGSELKEVEVAEEEARKERLALKKARKEARRALRRERGGAH